MAKQNKFKEYLSDMKNLYKYVFTHIWQENDPGVNIIQHFLTIVGTAALGIAASTSIASGAILPAVLLGLGAAATATDEVYHLVKRENPPIIARTISNLIGTVLTPPLLLVLFPAALAISATVDFFKGIKESVHNKSAEKSFTAEHESTQEHDNVSTMETAELTTTPTSVATNENLDLNNYYLEEDEQKASNENVEELSTQQNDNPTNHE